MQDDTASVGRADNLILHVGPHKTGTTAIQATLARNDRALAEHGYVYPRVGFNLFGHYKLFHSLQQPGDDLNGMVAALNDIHEHKILSCEDFSRAPRTNVEPLARGLSTAGVRVIYYARNFLDLIYSWWQERLKNGYRIILPEFMDDLLSRPARFHLFSPQLTFRHYGALFGRGSIEIYLYDELVAGEGTVEHFMKEVVGLPAYRTVERGIADQPLRRSVLGGTHTASEQLRRQRQAPGVAQRGRAGPGKGRRGEVGRLHPLIDRRLR